MPLEGLTLLDLSEGIAGAYCVKLLVDGGAEAVKVERPGGDPLRRWWASGRGDEPPHPTGALFEWLHASKASVEADLTTERGRSLVRTLVQTADVVVESFGPGVVESLGLGADDLRALNPACTLVSISDFGRGTSTPGAPATELTLQALSGSIHGRGLPGRFPVAAGGRLGEWAAGLYAAVGALVAWRASRSRGAGEHVDVSRLESMAVTLVGYLSLSRSIRGEGCPPYVRAVEIPCVERASDGWVGFCTVTNAQWQAFATMIGRLDLAEGPWGLLAHRLAHGDEVRSAIEAWTSQHTVEQILEEAAGFRVPAAPVVEGSRLADIEPFRSQGTYVSAPGGGFRAPRPPYRFSRSHLRPPGRAPALSETPIRPSPRPRPRPRPSPVGGREPAAARLPFAGLRVVDFSAFWAGPYATAFLAALGADVIKVESVQRPDPMRLSSVVPPSDPQWYEKSAIFGAVNANKRGITLALDTAEGRDLALRLVAGADVVVENFTPRVMERFRLAYDDLTRVQPALIMVRLSAFGSDSPWRERGGFAQTMEQITGMAWITGYADGPPLIPRGACDPIGGMHAVVALLMALEHRDRTGEGQLVDVSMVETAANVAAEIVIEWTAYGRLLGRDGNHGPEGSPQGVYRCRGDDRWVVLSVHDDGQWHRLRQALGDPAWARSAELATHAGRRDRAREVDGRLTAWTSGREADAVVEVLTAHGVPSSVVMPADHIDEVPQLRERGFWRSIDHPAAGRHDHPGWPMWFSSLAAPGDAGRPVPGAWRSEPAPLLGEHNAEVLGHELGLGADELAGLAERGIIGRGLRPQ